MDISSARLKVLIAASECAPFAKVGGLADVIGALPKALYGLGVDVRVILPYYSPIETAFSQSKFPDLPLVKSSKILSVSFGKDESVTVFESLLPGSAVPIYFLANDTYLSSGGIYFSKNAFASTQAEIERFAFFSQAVATFIQSNQKDWYPDIVNCNDWHTGLIPGLLSNIDGSSQVRKITTVFTIHNSANQGFAELSLLKKLNQKIQNSKPIIWDAADTNLDLMLQGIVNADVVSTVSPTYAKEILTEEFGEGLDQVLEARSGRLFGILNGIDYSVWDPATDHNIPFLYDLRGNFEKEYALKMKNKQRLQKITGLNVDDRLPLIGMVNRLAEQKGVDLVTGAFKDIIKLNAQLLILGVGDDRYEEILLDYDCQQKGQGNFAFINCFDEKVAHEIYAGADFFLMPSRFEPCGLVQLIAMRYGSLPIVRGVGGLKDTVKDNETGFAFDEYSPEALRSTVERAIGCYSLRNGEFKKMVQTAVREDFSWEKSARDYINLYQTALGYQE